MKYSLTAILLGSLAVSAAPAVSPAEQPTATIQKRADFCGQWDSTTTGSYIVYNNLWGQGSGSGSQCTGVDSMNGNTVAWHTKWNWSGGQYNVKSYANVNLKFTPLALSAVKSIPSTFTWSYTGSNMVANVAYDLFTSTTGTGAAENEVMIWLGALGGAGPISSTGQPVATANIAGRNWKLYEGPNGSMKVFSFVRDGGSDVKSFSADLNLFVKYLTANRGLKTSQILTTVQAGTEPFVGSNANLKVSAYSAAVNK